MHCLQSSVRVCVYVHLILLTGLGSQEEAGDGNAAQVLWTGLTTVNMISESVTYNLRIICLINLKTFHHLLCLAGFSFSYYRTLVLPGEYQSVPKPAERLKGLIHECVHNHMYECFAHKSVIHQHFVT